MRPPSEWHAVSLLTAIRMFPLYVYIMSKVYLTRRVCSILQHLQHSAPVHSFKAFDSAKPGNYRLVPWFMEKVALDQIVHSVISVIL